MAKKKIVFRGVQMIEGWPEKIQEAQLIHLCSPKGVEVERVRYGLEQEDWGQVNILATTAALSKASFMFPVAM